MEAQPRSSSSLPNNDNSDYNSNNNPFISYRNNHTNKLINIDSYSSVPYNNNNQSIQLQPHSIFNKNINNLLEKQHQQSNKFNINTYLDTTSTDIPHLLELNSINTKLPLYTATFENDTTNVLIDSGATENYISPDISVHADQIIPVYNKQVETAGGEVIKIEHKALLSIDLGGYKDRITAYVFPNKFGIILGRSWLKQSRATPDWLTDTWNVTQHGMNIQLTPNNHGTDQDAPQLNYLVSPKQAERLIKKHHANSYLIHIKELSSCTTMPLNSISSSEKDAYWTELVKQYTDVFKDELPGLPPDRKVQHVINTVMY